MVVFCIHKSSSKALCALWKLLGEPGVSLPVIIRQGEVGVDPHVPSD